MQNSHSTPKTDSGGLQREELEISSEDAHEPANDRSAESTNHQLHRPSQSHSTLPNEAPSPEASIRTHKVDGSNPSHRSTNYWDPWYAGNARTIYDPALKLKRSDVWKQRLAIFAVIAIMNAGTLVGALLGHNHNWVLAFILFVKSRDCISSLWAMVALTCQAAHRAIHRLFHKPKPIEPKWILSLIPAYSESEEQIVKACFALRDNQVEPHRQVICIILDGKPRDLRSHMTLVLDSFRRPYETSRRRQTELIIDIGFIENLPVIAIEKQRNAGKKDSLILCHDLFNAPRRNLPRFTRVLRDEMWNHCLPPLTEGTGFREFDMIFCTDADSIVYKGAVAALANELIRDPNAIAACGLLLAELENGREWSVWTLYQLFQYTFGQFVRRQAEGLWGRVSCLPGCINMIACRPEMAKAIEEYAEPVTSWPVIFHQVQYLGTDRRLTYLMLHQSKELHTAFVPQAMCETAVPQTWRHYFSQRRRWGSNAYFNDFFYVFGKNMFLITRLTSIVDIIRLSMVYYRIANTILFLIDLITHFDILRLVPLIVVTQFPTVWFVCNCVFLQPALRSRIPKLICGFWLNKVMSPVITITVFSIVLRNLGSQGTFTL